MSDSRLYIMNGHELAFTGVRMAVSWTHRQYSESPMVEVTCTMLDGLGNRLAFVDQQHPLSPDRSTVRIRHYHGALDTFTLAVSTTYSWVDPRVAALYYALHSPASLDLSELKGGRVEIEAFEGTANRPTNVYSALLNEFRNSQGLLVAGLIRTGPSSWQAAHLETPLPSTDNHQALLQMQEHLTHGGYR